MFIIVTGWLSVRVGRVERSRGGRARGECWGTRGRGNGSERGSEGGVGEGRADHLGIISTPFGHTICVSFGHSVWFMLHPELFSPMPMFLTVYIVYLL